MILVFVIGMVNNEGWCDMKDRNIVLMTAHLFP